jgi:phenylacetic acid degradation protein
VLIGDVIVGPRCFIGPAACLRGDFGRLILEEGANFQDTCVMHGLSGYDSVVEANGHIGHGVVLHGCRIGRNALIGMNAVILDRAVIGEDSLVAAMSLVKKGQIVAPRSLMSGSPAQLVRSLREEEIHWKGEGRSEYQRLAEVCLRSMREVDAYTEIEPDRKRSRFAAEACERLAQNRNAGVGGA